MEKYTDLSCKQYKNVTLADTVYCVQFKFKEVECVV